MFSFFVFIEYRFFASHIISEKSNMNLVQNREKFASTERTESAEKIEKNRLRSAIEKTSKFSRFVGPPRFVAPDVSATSVLESVVDVC